MIAALFSLRNILEVIDEPDNSYPSRIYTSDSSVLMANLYLMGSEPPFTRLTNWPLTLPTALWPSCAIPLSNHVTGTIEPACMPTSRHPGSPVDEGETFIWSGL